jgi:hypothetical protein
MIVHFDFWVDFRFEGWVLVFLLLTIGGSSALLFESVEKVEPACEFKRVEHTLSKLTPLMTSIAESFPIYQLAIQTTEERGNDVRDADLLVSSLRRTEQLTVADLCCRS